MKRNLDADHHSPEAKRPKISFDTAPRIRITSATGNMTPVGTQFSRLHELNLLTPFTARQDKFLKEMAEPTPTRFENVFVVEGNIGSGKSTLLKHFEKRGFTVIQEPVDNLWAKYLPRMYKDVKRWGMTFQFEVLFWYLELRDKILPRLLKDNSQRTIVIERSAHSGLYIFIKNLRQSNLMTEWEYDLLARFFHLTKWNAAKTFYLQVDPETCVQRIKERNRKGEDEIDRQLIQSLHNLHENLYVKKMHDIGEVVCLDARQDTEKVCEDALLHMPSPENEKYDNIIG